jgi:hypothetical protein
MFATGISGNGLSSVPNGKGKEKEMPRKRQRLMEPERHARDSVIRKLTEIGYGEPLKLLEAVDAINCVDDEASLSYVLRGCSKQDISALT